MEAYGEPPCPEWVGSNDALNLLQVLRLAQQALNAARTYEIVETADSVTVGEMMRWLEERLASGPERAEAEPLLTEQPTPQRGAALFLAMLELAKATRIRLEQHQCFGPLFIEKPAGRNDMAHPCLNVK